MGRRTLTGALVLAVVAGAFAWDRARGGAAWASAALVAGLALAALAELTRIGRAPRALGLVLGVAWLAGAASGLVWVERVLAAVSLAVLGWLALGLRAGPGPRTAALVARPGICVGMAGALALLVPPLLHGHLEWVFWIVIVSKTSDIAAYYTGRTLGRHPLAPRTSPRKTLEGAAGAVAGPVLLALTPWPPFREAFGAAGAAALGASAGVLALLADLVESLVKRSVGVKDSGTLLGEAGGVLDLVDSLLFVAPLTCAALAGPAFARV